MSEQVSAQPKAPAATPESGTQPAAETPPAPDEAGNEPGTGAAGDGATAGGQTPPTPAGPATPAQTAAEGAEPDHGAAAGTTEATEAPEGSGFFDRVRALMGDRGALRSLLTTERCRTAQLEGELRAAEARIRELEAQAQELETAKRELARLEREALSVESELEKLGVPAEEAPETVSLEETPEGMLEHFATLSGRERMEYYRENKAKLEAAEAVRERQSKAGRTGAA